MPARRVNYQSQQAIWVAGLKSAAQQSLTRRRSSLKARLTKKIMAKRASRRTFKI